MDYFQTVKECVKWPRNSGGAYPKNRPTGHHYVATIAALRHKLDRIYDTLLQDLADNVVVE
jgi:hypothetical protein